MISILALVGAAVDNPLVGGPVFAVWAVCGLLYWLTQRAGRR